ncbi:MAG: phage major capsid protein [Acidimicrobiales bacterium]
MTDTLTETDPAQLVEEVRALRAEVEELRTRRPAPVRAGHEFVYRKDTQLSYFRDRAYAQQDAEAASRLKIHAQEMDAYLKEAERRQAAAAERAAQEMDFEFRVNPSLVTGQGGYFSPPAWVIEDFATYPRPTRILAQLARAFPLPPFCQSVNLPRMTGGNMAAWQGNDDSGNPSSDVTDAAGSSEVVTISGQGDTAVQLLDFSPVNAAADWAWFMDLNEAYDYALEQQLLVGTGSGSSTVAQSQLPGILNLTGTGSVAYTDVSPTGSKMFAYLGQAAAYLGKNRKKPPEAWLMTTSRWAWLMSSEDTQLRPFEMPDLNGTKVAECPGSQLGWPVWLDDAMPTTSTQGTPNTYTGGTQDFIIACRPSDMFLFEGHPVTSVNMEPLSGVLGVRFILRNYVAAVTNRYPSGICSLGGTGLAVQTGF